MSGTVKTKRAILGPQATRWFGRGWLGLGYVFLYLPILALIIYSFNDSTIASVWGGFTLKWYGQLLQDREVITGLWLSMQIAFVTACSSVLLGIFAAFAMVKYKRFKGRTLFAGMVNAPLVMPEVIVGLSLLLMLVSMQRALGFPERGMLTIWLGHLLLGLAYATVVIGARLQDLPPQLEEAAMDLGAKPFQVFMLVTLPMIAQSLMSSWLLTFTLSLDDVVLSAFLSGPGATTLPLVIFSRARLGVSPSINAVATVIIFVVSLGVILASVMIARQERRRAQEMAAAQRAN
jgi:putrescine transport system permease protein